MNKFKDLKVWQKSMDLAETVYTITQDFPDKEKFGLTSQLRRSAVSIASNIAEGAGRNSNPMFLSFLHIALGSSYELETQILLSYRFKYIDDVVFDKVSYLLDETQKMLMGLIKSLKNTNL